MTLRFSKTRASVTIRAFPSPRFSGREGLGVGGDFGRVRTPFSPPAGSLSEPPSPPLRGGRVGHWLAVGARGDGVVAERDHLSKLKDAPVPPPGGEAKRVALAAAMAAFEKGVADAQGSAAPQRLSHASSPMEGKRKMRQTFYFNRALAASIAALMIGAPAAYMLSRNYAPGGGGLSNLTVGPISPPAEVVVTPRMQAPAAPAPSAPVAREERRKSATAAGALGGRVRWRRCAAASAPRQLATVAIFSARETGRRDWRGRRAAGVADRHECRAGKRVSRQVRVKGH